MKKMIVAMATVASLAACSGGNPFTETDPTDPGTDPTIPETIAGDVDSVTYDPVAMTLTVRGVGLDDTPYESVYTRKPGLDVPGYEAYTSQDSSLDRHYTAYARERDGVWAVVASGGPQFNYVIPGTDFGRNGTYSAPATTPSGGLVTYAGNYVGVLNASGSSEDLLPVAPGTDPDVLTGQVAEITGDILINADFADNRINGVIYNRVIADSSTSIDNLDLKPGDIAADGTFSGEVTQPSDQKRGDYAGVFGGTNATAVAGALVVENHITGTTGPKEYGAFVLAQCGTPSADPICTQPNP